MSVLNRILAGEDVSSVVEAIGSGFRIETMDSGDGKHWRFEVFYKGKIVAESSEEFPSEKAAKKAAETWSKYYAV